VCIRCQCPLRLHPGTQMQGVGVLPASSQPKPRQGPLARLPDGSSDMRISRFSLPAPVLKPNKNRSLPIPVDSACARCLFPLKHDASSEHRQTLDISTSHIGLIKDRLSGGQFWTLLTHHSLHSSPRAPRGDTAPRLCGPLV
jgi:hypothetical protein